MTKLNDRAAASVARAGSAAPQVKREHVLVCVSPSPANAAVIREAARLAEAFHAELTALLVETPADGRLAEQEKQRLESHMRLARRYGGRVETVYGEDAPFLTAEYAKTSGVTKAVLGQELGARRRGAGLSAYSERLMTHAPHVDLYLIPTRAAGGQPSGAGSLGIARPTVRQWVKTLLVLAAAVLAGLAFWLIGLDEISIFTVFVFGVLITAVLTANTLCGVLSTILGMFIFNFAFAEPRMEMVSINFKQPVTMLILLGAALLMGALAQKNERQSRRTAETAYRTRILLETDQMLQQAKTTRDLIEVTANRLMKLLDRDVSFYALNGEGLAPARLFRADESDPIDMLSSPGEREAALWTYRNNRHCGAGTATFPNARGLYLAVRTEERIHGVVGINLGGRRLGALENNLALSILGECALAFERDFYFNERERASVQAKNEKLRSNLLRAISHDLRTPLTSISGNASLLCEGDGRLPPDMRLRLSRDILDDSLWLIDLVENLLSITRLDDVEASLGLRPELLEDIIAYAAERVRKRNAGREIEVVFSPEPLVALCEARLIGQVIVNLLDNAMKYAPESENVSVRAFRQEGMIAVEVADEGPGIPDAEKPRIFEQFYAAPHRAADSRRGMGLGLALCRAIVTAHGGAIEVRDHEPHGCVFTFTLKEACVNGAE